MPVCNDPQLGALDRRLAAEYTHAYARQARTRPRWKATERGWVAGPTTAGRPTTCAGAWSSPTGPGWSSSSSTTPNGRPADGGPTGAPARSRSPARFYSTVRPAGGDPDLERKTPRSCSPRSPAAAPGTAAMASTSGSKKARSPSTSLQRLRMPGTVRGLSVQVQCVHLHRDGAIDVDMPGVAVVLLERSRKVGYLNDESARRRRRAQV